jgi:hypothetical protein
MCSLLLPTENVLTIKRLDIQSAIQGLPPQTSAMSLAVIKTVFREALAQEIIDASPAPEMPATGVLQASVDEVAAVDVIAAVPETAALAVENEVAGADTTRATTVIESGVPVLTVPAGNANVTGIVEVIPGVNAGTVPTEMALGTTACDGATETIPRPKAATATSAMRLKVVFVDICFLSISRVREFPELGFG